MLFIGLVLLLIGAIIAVALDRTIGGIFVIVGVVLVLVALLTGADLRT